MTPLLTLDRVCRRIGAKTLVEDVSLTLNPGRTTVLIGPNGAGKSSLIGLASGWQRPDAGRVLCETRDIASWADWQLAAKRVVLSQSAAMNFAFTAEDVVRIGCDGIGRGIDARARDGLVAEALDQADVTHLAARSFATLSGGEQQRVRFARSVAQLQAGRTVEDRQILILDEPVSGLDLKHQIFLLDAARALAARGAALLVVLHDLTLARFYADDLVVMADGRVVASGPPSDVLTRERVRDVFGIDPSACRGVLSWLEAA